MHAIDTNKNGVVESAEFVATGETQEEFNQLDLNGDGVLDADERASALVSSLGSMWVALIRPGAQVGKLIQRRAAAEGSSPAKTPEFLGRIKRTRKRTRPRPIVVHTPLARPRHP